MTDQVTAPTQSAEARAAERFAADTAEHQLTVLHDDGLYRHLRCAAPTTGLGWFEIVTWPGALAIRGDMDGSYVFSRLDDMFEFFRSNGHKHGINPGYWAEKIQGAARDTAKEYSEDVLRAHLEQELAEYTESYPLQLAEWQTAQKRYDEAAWSDRWPMKADGPREPLKLHSPDEIRKVIADHDDDGLLSFPEGARDLLEELERVGFVFDTWGWDLKTWGFHYLYACHSIVWAIRQYDAAKAVQA